MYSLANKIALIYISQVEVPTEEPLPINPVELKKLEIKQLEEIQKALETHFRAVLKNFIVNAGDNTLVYIQQFITYFIKDNKQLIDSLFSSMRTTKAIAVLEQFISSEKAAEIYQPILKQDIINEEVPTDEVDAAYIRHNIYKYMTDIKRKLRPYALKVKKIPNIETN